MIYYLVKLFVSALLIVIISEVAKKSSLFGAVIASVPLVSVLAIIWIYIDSKDIDQISSLSKSIFWLVLPSLVFFVALPVFLKHQINFYLSLFTSLTIMVFCYFLMIKLLSYFNISY